MTMDLKYKLKYVKDDKIIAIDPGKNGGIAIYSITKKVLIEVLKMPETPKEVLVAISPYAPNAVCYLEKVQGMPGQSGPGMFNFGRGFGHLEMALLARNIPTVEVTPQKWQKELQMGVKGKMSDTEWKNKLKSRAEQLYPNIKMTLAIADSLLILEYAKIKEGGKK